MSKTPPPSEGRNIDRLLTIMAQLRDPDGGCPWDIEQDFASIAPYTIEEAYEVMDAIQRNDMVDLRDELGDLLLQVVFHARIGEEKNAFDFDDVAGAISDKMIRRHPHVFDTGTADSPEVVAFRWEEAKAQERKEKGQSASALDGVAVALPALVRAEKLSKRAARVGFTWSTANEVFRDLDEEVDELTQVMKAGGDPERLEDEMGDVLFVVANLARMLNVDPEKALHRTNRKFDKRFRAVETLVHASGRAVNDVSLDELNSLWKSVKGVENAS